MAVTSPPKLDARKLRADFPIFEQQIHGKPLAYLDSAATAQKPTQVLDALREFYETSYANVHRGVYELSERATAAYESARQTMAGFVNAPSPKEIVFTRNATEGLNLVAYAWGLVNLQPGDLVVVTELEHHSNFVPWQYIASRTGAGFKLIPLDDQGELDLGGLDALSREGNVKVVAANLVSNSLGTVNPVEKLVAWAHEQGAIMVVDAAQAAPHRPIDVQALGCDFLAFSAHKLCGPTSVGALWGRLDLLEEMEPFNLGGHMIRAVRAEETTWGEVPAKFEAGTQPIAEAVGFAAAVDYITAAGLESIEQHEHDLADLRAGAAGRHPGDQALRAAARAARRHRLVQPRRPASPRRRAGPGHGRRRDPRRPPLLPAADAEARRGRHEPRELLPLHGAGRDRPARGRPAQGPEDLQLGTLKSVSDFYREVILDHYKNPRGHGAMESPDATAEGLNPLCGDEVTISVALADDGETIDEVKFEGRGCAISQAATSMLTEMVKGRSATDVATLPKEELLEEIGIPLTPIRLKCALLGLGVLKVALHRAKGTPLPEEWAGLANELEIS